MMLKTGEFVTLVHVSGTPTWGGEHGQTPSYTSGSSSVICRTIPVREEILVQEQIFGVGDVHGWFPYDVTVDIQDEVTYGSTSLFSGTYLVNWCGKTETSFEAYMKKQDGE